eukprot:5653006-Pyramimonas_sp.AAC.1
MLLCSPQHSPVAPAFAATADCENHDNYDNGSTIAQLLLQRYLAGRQPANNNDTGQLPLMQLLSYAGQSLASQARGWRMPTPANAPGTANPPPNGPSLAEFEQLAASCPSITFDEPAMRRACADYTTTCELDGCLGEFVRQ